MTIIRTFSEGARRPARRSFAEVLHAHVRSSFWGYAPEEHFTTQQLIRENYVGIRPAPGYPACPDHSLKPTLFKMLGGAPAGVTLTDNFAMLPTSAVSGFYFGHRDSQYFGVAPHRPRPARGLCRRRDVPLEEAERWLRPNLD
jgi:5-methyltetrahydrofolate--homocysteine methyltransferase